MICPQCGAENLETARFCIRCGNNLKQETAQPANATNWFEDPPAPTTPPGPYPPPRPEAGAPPAYGAYPPTRPETGAPPAYGAYPPPRPEAGAPPAYGYTHPPAPPPTYEYDTFNTAPPVAPAPPPAGYTPPPAPSPVQPAPRASRRSNSLVRNGLIVVGLLLLVGLGAGGFLVYQAFNKPNVGAARLLPPDAYGYLSIAAQPASGQKASLDKVVAAFKNQPGFQAAWARISSQMTGLSGSMTTPLSDCSGGQAPQAGTTPVSFDDLSAFLGNNITVAMLPLTKSDISALRGGSQPDKVLESKFLVLVDLDFNPLNKKGFLPRLKQLSEKPADLPLVETYRDVEIRKLPNTGCANADPTATPPDIYLALLSGTAAVGLDTAPLHEAIDRFKDGKSLQDTAAFQALDGELPTERLATLYLNLNAIDDTLKNVQAADQANLGLTDQAVALPQVDGSVVIALSAHDDGFQIDSVGDTQLQGAVLGAPAAASPDILNDIPADSWAFYSGADLKTLATQTLALLRKNDPQGEVNNVLAQAKEQTGVDVEQNLLPLLGGDYALSVQGNKGADGELVWSGVGEVRLKSGDGAHLTQVIDKFNQTMAGQGQTVTPAQLGGGQFYGQGAASPFLYGVAGDKFYILGATNPDGAQSFAGHVLDTQGKGLGTDATLKARLTHLPAGSNTVLYIDITKARTAGLEATMPADGKADYEQQYAPFLRPFQYLLVGGTTKINNTTTHTHGVVFLGIGQ